MKLAIAALLVAGPVLAGTVTFAQAATADDIKWINQCIADNKGQPGATPDIVKKYCTCMNEKMDNNETQSISQWEKTHKAEREACDKEAGWK
ncbi:MAG TPA: hypothetical protein VKX28_04450 [Xanthobacteraceae bacterium]|nr:hypothetical protein [Xanthobacteraceae bacterium]